MTLRRVLLAVLVLAASPAAVRAEASFSASAGQYQRLLQDLHAGLYLNGRVQKVTLDGEERQMFISWIRDHVHVMKAFKYWEPDVGSYVAFFLGRQTPEGMYYDYWRNYREESVGELFFTNVFDRSFYFVAVDQPLFFFRMPVEADLEYLLVEGVFTHWQASGDRHYLRRWLPTLEKGLGYAMSHPLRWSPEHLLVQRPYSIDTWDFVSEPDGLTGVERLRYHLGNDERTPKGIMHGDNSGMYQACRQLAILHRALEQPERAQEWDRQAELLQSRLNRLCWNGRHYAHFVPIDPPPPHVAIDHRETLSLSNTYDINRGVTTPPMADSILRAYQDVWRQTRTESVAEWFGIYPWVEPHFGRYPAGEYVNGAVLPLVGGELAKAAFQHGHEAYGVELLERLERIMNLNDRRLPGCVNQDGSRQQEAIPDEWGQAAFISALVEGLAGVVDRGHQFSDVELSPRWIFAEVAETEVRIGYGREAQVVYRYHHDAAARRLVLEFSGRAGAYRLRLPLPTGTRIGRGTLDGRPVTGVVETVGASSYAVFSSGGPGTLAVIYE